MCRYNEVALALEVNERANEGVPRGPSGPKNALNALCVFGKRGPKMFNFELLFLHRFSSKNREILHKAVLTPQEYEDYFF